MNVRTISMVAAGLFASLTLAFAGNGESCSTKSAAKAKAGSSCCATKSTAAVKKVSDDHCSTAAKSSKECSTEKAAACATTASAKKDGGSCCSMKAKDVKSTSLSPKTEVGVVTPEKTQK